MREALSVLVRVRGDAAGTVDWLERQASRKDLPEHIKRYLGTWLEDARAWKAERFDTGSSSREQLLAEARHLLATKESPATFAPEDDDFVTFLRVSNYIHEALSRSQDGEDRAEALYMLGVSSMALREAPTWDVEEVYFEACIREAPHSALAKECYMRLLDGVYFGYSGSAGTDVPDDELQRLVRLREAAY
jgi:hypothetical protein